MSVQTPPPRLPHTVDKGQQIAHEQTRPYFNIHLIVSESKLIFEAIDINFV
jgi:hypothetical protein